MRLKFLWANMGWGKWILWWSRQSYHHSSHDLNLLLNKRRKAGPLALYRRCLVWCLSTNLTENRLPALMRAGWSQLLEAADAWLQLSCDVLCTCWLEVLGAVKWWRNSTKSQILIISQAVHLLYSDDLMLRSTEKILRRISPPSTISPCLSAQKSVPWC